VNTQLTFRDKIGSLWTNLTGDPSVFPLEYRITHSICLIAIVSLAYNVPFNLMVELPVPALISLVAGALFSYLYYRSRFMGKMRSSIVMCAILANAIFIINYFYNSGIGGPTDILIALSILLVIAISPHRQHKIWLSLNIITILALHLTEYYFPAWVPDKYEGRSEHFFDVTSAYLVVVIVMYYTIKYIRRNYDYEKRQAEEKTQAIEDQHQYILVQNEQLEHLNSEKNKLMSIIAHDLRGPLSNIQNYLELVTEYGLDKEEREVVEGDLLKVTQSTLNMLSKLLIWSKSQMDGVVVKLSNMSLSDTLKNTLEMERILALKKDIILTYTIDPSIYVVADSDMLQLVVRNIVSNAIKFTPVKGTVDIGTEMLGNECKISVKDTGRGIPLEQQGDIFSLKARSTFGTNNEKGVGLGLLLCKEFTEQQGGRIGFESIPDRGSTFFVFIPTVN
jgi:two-component system sensor histidine kinase/response regulator